MARKIFMPTDDVPQTHEEALAAAAFSMRGPGPRPSPDQLMQEIANMEGTWISPDQELLSLLAQTMVKLQIGGYKDSHELLMAMAALIRRNMQGTTSSVMDADLLHLMQVELDNVATASGRMEKGLRFGDRTLHIAGGWFLGYLRHMNDLAYVRRLASVRANNAYEAALTAARSSGGSLARSVRATVPPLTANLGPAIAILDALRPQAERIRDHYENWFGFDTLVEA